MSFLKKRVVCLVFALLCVLPLCRTAQAVDITTIASGLNGAYGSDFRISLNSAFFVERYAGKIWRINMNTLASAAVGTGYTEPMDIALSVDDAHAYVIENGAGGTLLRVSFVSPNRADATVVATNIAGTSGHIMGQLALDEAHGYAYVVQNSGFGRLWRINLTTGAKTEMLANISTTFGSSPLGVILSNDLNFAYISLLGLDGKVIRYNLVTNSGEILVSGLSNPSFLEWANPAQSAIYIAEACGSVGRVSLLDLTDIPAGVHQIVTGLPNCNTRSVTVISADRLLVSVHTDVVDVKLSEYDASGPLILGIGHVPFDRIFGGYADTTGDPGYFFQVNDAPFGSTLSLMINHTGAYNNPRRGRWYQVLVDGVVQQQSWGDYRWEGISGFVFKTMSPQFGGYYPVRNPGDIWYNHWLGYRLDTTGLTNGLHTISVNVHRGARRPAGRPVWTDSLRVMIDNRWPTALIEKIYHGEEEVSACAIVDNIEGGCEFTFQITAHDPDGHLSSWQLSALWGDNCSSVVDSDSYSNHLPGPLWSGISSAIVPNAYVPGLLGGDCGLTSCNCAHTFYLGVWDRTIDGYNHIHWSSYHKSLTIMLPACCEQLF